DSEIEVIAQIGRYHRYSEPKQSHPPFAAMASGDQCLVRSLAGALRVVIGLGRRHEARVAGVRVTENGDGRLTIAALAADSDDIGLELYAAQQRTSLLERVLDRQVEVVAG